MSFAFEKPLVYQKSVEPLRLSMLVKRGDEHSVSKRLGQTNLTNWQRLNFCESS